MHTITIFDAKLFIQWFSTRAVSSNESGNSIKNVCGNIDVANFMWYVDTRKIDTPRHNLLLMARAGSRAILEWIQEESSKEVIISQEIRDIRRLPLPQLT